MTNFHSLPPELVLEIFSLASRLPRLFPTFDDMRERNKTLLSLALVHSTWTSLAQESLSQEVMIDGTEDDCARKLKLLKEDSQRIRPKGWTFFDAKVSDWLLNEGGASEAVERFQHMTLSSNRLGDYTRFSNLDALFLFVRLLDVSALQSGLAFLHLRRLALRARIQDISRTLKKHLLSPTYMPGLRHLAIDVESANPRIFDAILPQLETLAVSDLLHGDSASVLHDTSLLDSLQHLSLESLSTQAFPFDQLTGLDLESLHVSSRWLGESGRRLLAVAMGKDKSFRSKRVVVYGTKAEREVYFDGLDLEVFQWREWREDEAMSRFAEFTGK